MFGSEDFSQYATRVQQAHQLIENRDDTFKFTKDMIIIITGDIAINEYDQPADELNKVLHQRNDLSIVTKTYLEACDNKLGNYNPRKVKENLQKMDMI